MERSDAEEFVCLIDQSSTTAVSDNMLFDASQYAFFGGGTMDEVELGGLEEGGEDVSVIRGRFGGEDDSNEYHLFEKDEGSGLGSLSDIDDLATTFAKLNRVVPGPRHPGVIRHRGSGSCSRESSATTEWAREPDFPERIDRHMSDSECYDESTRWSSQPHSYLSESKQIFRTSSYPDQPHHLHHCSSEPILLPKASLDSRVTNLSSALSGAIASPLSSPARHSSGPHYLYNTNDPYLVSPDISRPSRFQNQWNSNAGVLHGDRSILLNSILQRQCQNGLLPIQPPQSQRSCLPIQPSLARFLALQSQVYSTFPSPNKHGPPNKRELKTKGKNSVRFSHQGSDASNLLQFRSKYMTAEEIEVVLKIQQAAAHGSDPYVDDYYHQARLAKKSTLKFRFCPSNQKEQPWKTRNSMESISLIHRPSPLFEVDNNPKGKSSEKLLKQEPMFAARIAVEELHSLLLEVDDIDRLLQFSQPHDGNESHLRWKRGVLLQSFSASLNLVDPLGKNGNSIGISSEDDIVFLRILSFSKGWKLMLKFLRLLLPGSELARVVCMAIFRHLRFLFGVLPADPEASRSINELSGAISSCVSRMDLNSLSACLAAVVCSPEQPPLRPLGSSSGDGASIVLKSALDRATNILRGEFGVPPNPALWQASFNAFFGLLTNYCIIKYESLVGQTLPNSGAASGAVSRELPVELLRASLPHTDESQKRLLLNFVQRSMLVTGFNTRGENTERINPESIRG